MPPQNILPIAHPLDATHTILSEVHLPLVSQHLALSPSLKQAGIFIASCPIHCGTVPVGHWTLPLVHNGLFGLPFELSLCLSLLSLSSLLLSLLDVLFVAFAE